MRIKTIIPDSYVKGARYLRNPMARELMKVAHLPHKQFMEVYNHLKNKSKKEE